MRHVFPGLVAVLLAIPTTALQGGINFGSRQSAFETSGGTLDFDTNATLSKGTLRITSSSGGIVGDTGEYLSCEKMRIFDKHASATKGIQVDGRLSLFDDTLEIEDNNLLIAHGGEVAETVTVSAGVATPGIIQGHGLFAAGILIDGGQADTPAAAGAKIRWQSELNQNITLTTGSYAATLILDDDLTFAAGSCPLASSNSNEAKIKFSGYTMTLGGGSTGTLTIGPNNQKWDRGRLRLNGDVTVSSTITYADEDSTNDSFFIDGGGHTITVSGALNAAVDMGFLSNATLDSYSSSAFTGSMGEWVLKDVTFKNDPQAMYVKYAMMAGNAGNVFGGNVTWSGPTEIQLLRDYTLAGTMNFYAGLSRAYIDGQHHQFIFDTTSSILEYSSTLTLDNITLKDVVAESINNNSNEVLYLNNVVWHDGAFAGMMRILPTRKIADRKYAQLTLPTSTTAGLLYGANATWNNGASLELLTNTTLSGTWTFTNISEIFGNGHVFNLSGGAIDFDDDLYLTDVIVGDVASTSFVKATGKHLYLTNTVWLDDPTEGAIQVISGGGTAGTIAPAQLLLNDTDSGNLFSTAVTWVNGVSMELLDTTTLGAVWTFSQSSTIRGNSNVLDLGSTTGALTIAENETLTLSNVIIKNWGTGSIVFGNNNATLILENVTVVMSGDVTLGANEKLTFNGPVYFSTRNYIFDASLADANNTGAGMTVWYDVISATGGRPNLLFGDSSGIDVRRRNVSAWVDLYFGDNGKERPVTHVDASMWLDYDIDVSAGGPFDAIGKQITLANNNPSTLRGNGRTWYLGNAPMSGDTAAVATDLITVAGDNENVIEIHDLTFDGWNEAHITDTNSLIRYGQGTVIRLKDNQALTTSINVATDVSGEAITIDLNGHELDLSHDNAAINISNINATLTICNGRLINVQDGSGSEKKILPAGSTSTVIFKDVDIVLSGNTTFTTNNITFKGNCSITGTGDYTLSCYYTPITIASGSCLRIGKGMTLSLYGDGENGDASVAFGSRNATLFIDGSTFDVSNLVAAPALTTGTIRVDHQATFAGDMTLGSGTANLALDIDLMPAASMLVTGSVTYANAT